MEDYDDQRPVTRGSVAGKSTANGSRPASAKFTIGAGVPASVASEYQQSTCCGLHCCVPSVCS